MPFLDLPNEIILQIAKALDIGTQNSLLRTNCRLAALLPEALIAKVFLDRDGPFGAKALFSAAGRGDKAMVRKLIDKGISTLVGEPGLLNMAVKTENVTVIRMLLDCGIDPESRGTHSRTPLIEAAGLGQVNTVRLLVGRDDVDVNSQDIFNKTALSYAAIGGHYAVVQALLNDARTDVNFRTAEDSTPLHLAASHGHHKVVRVLLSDTRTDASACGVDRWTPLHAGAGGGYARVVKALLEDDRVGINARDNFGWTALHVAAAGNHTATMQHLLDDDRLEHHLRETYGSPYYTRWTAGNLKRRCCIS